MAERPDYEGFLRDIETLPLDGLKYALGYAIALEARLAECEAEVERLTKMLERFGYQGDWQRDVEREAVSYHESACAFKIERDQARARLAECEAALRRIENYPFDVNADAVSDLRSLKDIARAALAAQGGEHAPEMEQELPGATVLKVPEQHPEDTK